MAPDVRRTTDHLIVVLKQLDEMAEANIGRSRRIKERIDHLLERLEAGEELAAIVEGESQPLIPTLITENIEALQDVGSALRRAEAAALRAHGYTMGEIASLFGVTRQRISALLDESRGG